MIITSTLSNFLSNFNNHIKANKTSMIINKSRLLTQLINILINEGILRGYKYLQNNQILLFLKISNTTKIINKIKIISKPGKRFYVTNKQLFQYDSKTLLILSTSKGLMTQQKAKSYNLGGELLCQIS